MCVHAWLCVRVCVYMCVCKRVCMCVREGMLRNELFYDQIKKERKNYLIWFIFRNIFLSSNVVLLNEKKIFCFLHFRLHLSKIVSTTKIRCHILESFVYYSKGLSSNQSILELKTLGRSRFGLDF